MTEGTHLSVHVVENSEQSPVLFAAWYVSKEICSLDLTLPELLAELHCYLEVKKSLK